MGTIVGFSNMQTSVKYVVHIITVKKSDVQTFEWHGEHSVFNPPTTLKIKLMDTFKDKLPSTPDLSYWVCGKTRWLNKLKEIHGEEKYDSRQLMLWGRMIVNDQWKSYDDPPDIPLITGGARKFQRRETISEAITGAALAFAKAISPPTNQQSTVQAAPRPPVQSGVSPMSKARLSNEYITQVKSLQELRDCGDEEFLEQKSFALNNIRSINTKK